MDHASRQRPNALWVPVRPGARIALAAAGFVWAAGFVGLGSGLLMLLAADTAPELAPFGLVGLVTLMAAASVLGFGLARASSSRSAGLLLASGIAAFVLTRPWQLGAVQVEFALRAQMAVEILLTLAVGVGWGLVATSERLRGRMPTGNLEVRRR